MNNQGIAVLGMGNHLLCDDTVGLHIVESLEIMYGPVFPCVRFSQSSAGGLDILFELDNCGKAIIVDSIFTGQKPPGHCHEIRLSDIDHVAHGRLAGTHGLNLPTIVNIGRRLGYTMPTDIQIFAVESTEFERFSPEPTCHVKNAIPGVIDKIVCCLNQWQAREPVAVPAP